ncbi:MAG: hypothetical protein QM773_13405 [Hyphomonadaceae bacterium]
MGRSIFDYIGNLDTLLAVILGAILATGGALVADLVKERSSRSQRQRDAARFFGELLTSIDLVLDAALETQPIGDRWGSITQRLFRTALDEARVYERNRERLFEIQDMNLRFRIHEHFLRKFVSMIALIEYSDDIADSERRLAGESQLADGRRNLLEAERSTRNQLREAALGALLEEKAKTRLVTVELEKLAKVRFVRDAAQP